MKRMTIILPKMATGFVFITIALLGLQLSPCLAMQGPTAEEYGVVLNLSGKQRMLTQKMSKEIMLIALGENVEGNLKNLGATATLFDRTLKGLRDGDTDLRLPPTESKRIRKQLDKIEAIWIDFDKVVKGILGAKKVSKDQIAVVATKNLPLLKQMNKGVKLYEKDASQAGLKAAPGLAVTINLSGKQRMLTQKMSKEFLLVAYGHDVENNQLNLLETYSLFERTLKGLQDGDATLDLPGTKDDGIRKQLSVVEGLWKSFKKVVAFGADPKTTAIGEAKIKQLATENLPLLKEMNRAVGMYEKMAAK